MMNFRTMTLSAFSAIILLASCKKDSDDMRGIQVELSATDSVITGPLNTTLSITATIVRGNNIIHEWKVNDSVYSRTNVFTIAPKSAGAYTIIYSASGSEGIQTNQYILNIEVPIVAITPSSSKYISTVFDYLPAPGQSVNKANVGTKEQAQLLIGATSKMLTLGAYGGYVIFGFDHSVNNKEGYDLGIYGNPITGASEWAEPGIVMVSQDINGNSLPDDPWYELAGSEYNDPTTIKNYKITYYNPKVYANVPWKDNQGNTGNVLINSFNKQVYYPLFAANQDSISFSGSLLRSTFGKPASVFVNNSFSWGYTDSGSVGDNYSTNKYNGFDISWAKDAKGNTVQLNTIDFVKVYTGQNHPGNTLMGEISTEITGAIDLHIK